MAEEAYLNREDVLKILKINDEALDALVREGKLQEKEEGKFDEEDVIMYATEYPPDLEEEMKMLPSIEEPAEEEKEEEIEILAPHEKKEAEVLPLIEEPAEEEKEEEIEILAPHEEKEAEVLPLIEEPVLGEGLPIEPVESEDKAETEPKIVPEISEIEESVIFETRELASPKESSFFTFLSLFSLVITLASIGILVLPVLDIAIPEFIKPAVDFVGGFF